MTSIHEKRLYVRPEAQHFDSTQQREFHDELKAVAQRTVLTPVDSVRDLEMDSYGKLPNRSRLLSTAFGQVCKTLSNGSRKLLIDVSGMHRAPDEDEANYSFSRAVEIYNSLLSLRYQRLEGRATLVLDTKTAMVDGILGPAATFMENSEIYEQADALMPTCRRPVKFHNAILTGRRMVLRYITEEPIAVLPGPKLPERYFGGFHFSNNSITGESIRAGITVLREKDDAAACGGFSSVGTVRHTGKSFRKNLNRMFRNALVRFERLDGLTGMLGALRRRNLGFTEDQVDDDARIEAIVRVMHRSQIPKGICRKIVATAMHFGSDKYLDDLPDLEFVSRGDVRTRTELDLYNAATRVAKDLSVQLQEATEQLAYRLLTGRLHITQPN